MTKQQFTNLKVGDEVNQMVAMVYAEGLNVAIEEIEGE